MWNKRKSVKDTKSKLQLLKRFLSGEDVVNDILNDGIPKITGMVLVSNDLSKLTTEQLHELNAIEDKTERGRRAKEIGVRKVFGASLFQIIVLLSRSFFRQLLLAGLIGIPLSALFLYSFLNQFAYRINPLAGIVVAAVRYHTETI